jgi:hypothetical protein
MTQRRTSTAAITGTVMFVAGPGGADAESFTAAVGSGDRPWWVGIVDPHRQRRLLTVAELSDGAVATSGTVPGRLRR